MIVHNIQSLSTSKINNEHMMYIYMINPFNDIPLFDCIVEIFKFSADSGVERNPQPPCSCGKLKL